MRYTSNEWNGMNALLWKYVFPPINSAKDFFTDHDSALYISLQKPKSKKGKGKERKRKESEGEKNDEIEEIPVKRKKVRPIFNYEKYI